MAVRGPLIEQLVVNRFTEVRDLLQAGRAVAPEEETLQRVVQRERVLQADEVAGVRTDEAVF